MVSLGTLIPPSGRNTVTAITRHGSVLMVAVLHVWARSLQTGGALRVFIAPGEHVDAVNHLACADTGCQEEDQV